MPTHLAVLQQLVVGSPRTAIAETLFLSGRTVDKRVAEIKQALETSTRLCLGARAVRHHLTRLTRAGGKRSVGSQGSTWYLPTQRQRQIIWLLASDVTVDEVPARIRVSMRTLRRDLSDLAATNGAHNLIHAGALFEALAWTALS